MIGIAARSKNNVIGKNGAIPWSCPEDLDFFKRMTVNKNIIVGSTTFKTLPFLPHRDIFIMTKRNINDVKMDVSIYPQATKYFVNGRKVEFVNSVFDVPEDSFLCGGAEIYKRYMEYCEYFYLTTIDKEVDGDTTFPMKEFLELFTRKEEVEKGDGYIIEIYRK